MTEHLVNILNVAHRGDVLPPGEVHQVRRALGLGGLCLLPSDTCYALAGNPLRRGVPSLVDAVLDRGEQKIPLSFASQAMIERYVDLGYREYRILDAADKNTPLTLVAPISDALAPNVREMLPKSLFTNAELGVRLPHSWIERQISAEMDGPITTAAIYYSDGTRIVNFDDAIEITIAGLLRIGRPDVPLIAIRHPPFRSRDVSSVVGFVPDPSGQKSLVIYRQGAVERKKIIEIAGRWTPRDVEEWT
jgi:tRNA A37 threonylcarbamoyladenosine synthetase subunit TsaC/SUA5/YrdC